MTIKWVVALFAVHIAIYVGAYLMLAEGLSCVSLFEPSGCSAAEEDRTDRLLLWGFYAGLFNLFWSLFWLYLALRLLVRGIRRVLNRRVTSQEPPQGNDRT